MRIWRSTALGIAAIGLAMLEPAGGFAQRGAPASTAMSTRIVGGVPAPEGRWPWQVQVYIKRGNGQFGPSCGGSLIDARWVLTAAHCFNNHRPEDVMIVEGTLVIDNPLRPKGGRGRAIAVRRILSHEHYDRRTQQNDIALLELASPARSPTITLAGAQDGVIESAGRNVFAVGWGLLRPIRQQGDRWIDPATGAEVRPGDPNYFTNRLMQVEIPIVARDTCKAVYAGFIASGVAFDDRTLCAGLAEGGRDTCQGDSGGPLLITGPDGRFRQIGVTSWGRGCAEANSYGVYTRVAAFRPWIAERSGLREIAIEAAPAKPQAVPAHPDPAPPTLSLPANVRPGDRVLLIGIDRYENERFNLKGSLNDVRHMRQLLVETFAYRPEQILTLTDAQATRANILAAIDRWLIAGSTPQSRVFFFFSGHGFQETDLVGDEPDGLDETLVPYDAAIEENGEKVFIRNQIIDDELRERFEKISDRQVTAVVDACFSGTSTRALAGGFPPGTVRHLGTAFSNAELKAIENGRNFMAQALDRQAQARIIRSPTEPDPNGFVVRTDHVTAWSATDDRQLALVDLEAELPQGVFTRRFIEGIRDKRADRSGDGTVSFAELLDYVRRESDAYCRRNAQQCPGGLSPQLEGRREILAADVVSGRLPQKPQEVAANALAHDNAAEVQVDFLQGTTLRVGQTAQFRVSARARGHLVLLDLTPDGKMTQVFPNKASLRSPTGRGQRANLIEPGRPLIVPDHRNPYEGFEFRVDPPAGEGLLIAVLSEEPLQSLALPDYPQSYDGSHEILDYVTRMSAELNRAIVIEDKPAQPRRWSVAVSRYRILP